MVVEVIEGSRRETFRAKIYGLRNRAFRYATGESKMNVSSSFDEIWEGFRNNRKSV
jgi:hypothetical protein